MAKTELTKTLEKSIWSTTACQGTFGCYEVTIGWYGKERVDYMTYDTKGIFRCYEIKVSVSDFHSKSYNTFVGHLNYYVMPRELYEKVKDQIPKGIGVFVEDGYKCCCVKRAIKRQCTVDEQVLKDSMIRSLSRDVQKFQRSTDKVYLERLNTEITQLQSQLKQNRREHWNLVKEIEELYGHHWNHPNSTKEDCE